MENLYREENNTVRQRIGYFFLATLPAVICITAQFVIQLIVLIYAGFEEAALLESSTYATFIYHIFGICFFGLWYYLLCIKKAAKVKTEKKKISVLAVVLSILMGITLCLFANGIVALEFRIVPSVVEAYMEMVERAGMFEDIFSMIAAVSLAPVGEELLCRGLTLHFAKRAFPKFWQANILQAALFGFIHLNWVQGIYAFAIGLCLGYMKENYQSLIPAILIHFTVNFSSTFWIEKAFGWIPDTLFSDILLFVVPFVLILFMVYLTKKEKLKKL
ncbi:MAG: lysostaphin resistance A-like protein [Lachnospiraceae bacterium]